MLHVFDDPVAHPPFFVNCVYTGLQYQLEDDNVGLGRSSSGIQLGKPMRFWGPAVPVC